MKSFSHLKRLNDLKVSRKALRHYALYRSIGKHLDVSLSALKEFHSYEALGVLPISSNGFTDFSKSNGYAYGKWILKLTQDTIIKDLTEGNVVKAEFMNSSHIFKNFGFYPAVFQYKRSNWFWYNCIKNITIFSTPFWYS